MTIGKKIEANLAGKTYVVGDVHGCLRTFRSLLEEKMDFAKRDYLFLLGDYIDKGAESKGVLDYLLELKRKGYQIFPLRGNHEEDLLNYVNRSSPKSLLRYMKLNKTEDLLDEQGKLQAKYLRFLEKMPYYYELPNHLLVHAGFNLHIEQPFEDTKAMLWSHHTYNDFVRTNKKVIIHGHHAVPLEVIQRRISENSTVIPLDNGCVYARRKLKDIPDGYLGHLCGLCIETYQLFVQPNIEGI